MEIVHEQGGGPVPRSARVVYRVRVLRDEIRHHEDSQNRSPPAPDRGAPFRSGFRGPPVHDRAQQDQAGADRRPSVEMEAHASTPYAVREVHGTVEKHSVLVYQQPAPTVLPQTVELTGASRRHHAQDVDKKTKKPKERALCHELAQFGAGPAHDRVAASRRRHHRGVEDKTGTRAPGRRLVQAHVSAQVVGEPRHRAFESDAVHQMDLLCVRNAAPATSHRGQSLSHQNHPPSLNEQEGQLFSFSYVKQNKLSCHDPYSVDRMKFGVYLQFSCHE